jgi:hypothetical protein
MGLSVNQAIDLGVQLVERNRPYLYVGPPGCGKTDAQKAIAKITRRKAYLSQPAIDDPTDYKGLPFISEGVARFFPIGMINQIMEETEPSLWIIDDLGQAPVAVQNAIMQFVHYRNRELNGNKIPDCVSIAACSNGREHNAGVAGLTDPLKGRFVTIVEVDTSLESWTEWACANGIDPSIISYLHYRPANLNRFESSKDFNQSPTPRGWESMNDLLHLNYGDQHTRTTVFAGCVGEDAAVEFSAFEDILGSLPNLSAIERGDNPTLPTKNMALYALAGALSTRGLKDPAQLQNVMDYMDRMPSEYQVLWTEIFDKRNPAQTKWKEWTAWCLSHKDSLAI